MPHSVAPSLYFGLVPTLYAMPHPLIISRYALLVLFIILNAITAIVAAWNWGSSTQIGINFQIDTFLIVNGAMGLFLAFPVLFVDLIKRGAFPTQVWFEIGWVSVFWLLNLSGAAAVTAIEPHTTCSIMTSLSDACTSTHALIVTTWLTTLLLLGYLLALVICSALNMTRQHRIWFTDVRDVDWFGSKSHPLKSSPSSPVLPIYKTYSTTNPFFTTIVVPKANLLPQAYLQHEKPVPPIPAAVPTVSRPISPPRHGALPSRQPVPRELGPSTPQLYPQVMQQVLPNRTPVAPSIPEPPPAGQWPRPNPVDPPTRKPRSAAVKSSASPILSQTQTSVQPAPRQPSAPPVLTSQSATGRQAPLGPRKPRPPPLDLSKLSNHQSGRQRSRRRI